MKSKRNPLLALALCLSAGGLSAAPDEGARLLRQPDVEGDTVVFVWSGDLWRVPLAGGHATRLTADPGQELYPKLSPDGRWIAFSAEYSGTRQVYVMPSAGGEPRQLTWYNDIGPMPVRGGTDYRVLDWDPDGDSVIVRANRVGVDERAGRPFRVPVDGGMEQPMDVPMTGGGMLSPDGKAFVYTPIDRDFRSWKRYRGGRAQDVWVFDLETRAARQVTDHVATDHQPLWVGDRIWFVSDRDYTLNLYSMPATGEGEPVKVTRFDEFDVLWPSAGRDTIVFENGGWLYSLDPDSGTTRRITVHLQGDHAGRLPSVVNVAGDHESFAIAPDGSSVAFGARGEVFTVPVGAGPTRNLTHTPDAREHSLSWSPDGKQLAFLSDASGEYEIWLRSPKAEQPARRLTSDGDIWRFPPVWSPDGKYLAYGDKKQRLRVVDVASGKTREVDQSPFGDITEYAFSPDSRSLAYTRAGEERNTSIWVHDLISHQNVRLTDPSSRAFSPAFDPKGRWLYFASNRDFNLTFSAHEFNYLYTRATRIYAGELRPGGKHMFEPRDEGWGAPKAESDKPAKESDAKPAKRSTERTHAIDAAHFARTIAALKIDAGNYGGLSASANGVFYAAVDGGGQNAGGELRFYNIDKHTHAAVVARMSGYQLSHDGKKLLLQTGPDTFSVVDAAPDQKPDAGKLDLSALKLRIEPQREWRQLYTDAWRILRDWFYDPNMHGQDWKAIHDRYRPLVEHVNQRADLDYIFHEIAGELNAGHVYVNSPASANRVQRKPSALLGAEFVKDRSGWFRISHIFAGEPWHPDFRSPMHEAHVDAKVGELVTAIDGVSTREVANIYQLLEGKATQLVELTLAPANRPEATRTVRVNPIASEQNLRYLEWVENNRRRVDELSGGKIGYIHVPNTAIEGNRELFKGMLAWAHKPALIIDDRYNGGGFIPDRMIEMLARQPLNYWVSRGLNPAATPLLSHDGPKAMLINGLSSSGGDALPYYFRKLGLGTLIGTRTWGGLIGISGNPALADGGAILAATFRFLDTEGNWRVENEGVSPDIEVVDRPDALAAGGDPSLERAVQELMKQLEAAKARAVTAPPAPSSFGSPGH